MYVINIWLLKYLYAFGIGSQNITINTASFTPGIHTLAVTIITEGGQTSTSELLTFEGNVLVCINNSIITLLWSLWFTVVRFALNCTVVENRTLTVQCEGIYGVINKSEVTCVYDSGQIQEKCRYNMSVLACI